MASVDPYQLLKALSILLNKDGSIKGQSELTKLLNLMKAARKLVSRCIYINILRVTTEKALLEKFVVSGGWEILNLWLQEAKENDNHPFVLELIKLYKIIPVTLEILKATNTAKIIKQFSKGDGDDRLKACSTDLVNNWMIVIRGSGPAVEKPSVVKKKKVKKPAVEKVESPRRRKEGIKEVKTEKKDGNNKRTSEAEKKDGNNKRTSITEKKDANNKRTSETEKKDGNNKRTSETEKKDGNNKRTLDTEKKDGTSEEEIVKKIKTEDHEKSGRTSPTEDNKKVVPKKEFKSGDSNDKLKGTEKAKDTKEEGKNDEGKEVKRPTRVKTRSGPAFAKFRSTGLESDAKLPPVIKHKRKTDKPSVKPEIKSITVRKREGPLLSKSLTPPEKKVKKEEKEGVKERIERRTSSGIRIKIIPPKPRLQEGLGFLEALNAPVTPVRKKVKKHGKGSPSNKDQAANTTGKSEGNKSEKASASSPEDTKPDPPKFNFYSNAEPEEGKDDNSVFGEIDAPKDAKTEGEEKKSNLKILPSRKKKTVTWKEDSELVKTCYFDLDENERENVNRPKDFRDAAQMEMRNEAQFILNAKKGNLAGDGDENGKGNGNGLETIPWRRPPKLDIDALVVYGSSSKEKVVQTERERTVLQVIFFNAAMIPDTPREPDLEAVEVVEPTRIPLEDEATPDPIVPQVSSIPSISPIPSHMGMRRAELPPEVAKLVNQHVNPMDPGDSSMDKIQEILSSVMSDGNQAGIPQDVDIHSEDFTNKLREIIAPFKGELQHTDAEPPPMQPPPLGPPPLMDEGLLSHPILPPPGYAYDPMEEPYPDPRGQYPEYGDYQEIPPEMEMEMEDPSYQGYESYEYQHPEGRYGQEFRFRGPRPPGPMYRGRGGRGRATPKVCYHYTSFRGCRLGKKCHFFHPMPAGPLQRR